MSIKTILVHLADDEFHRCRLDVALRMAKQHGSHIVALFITTPEGMPAVSVGRGASAEFLSAAHETAKKTARALEEEFEGMCERSNVRHTWVTEDGAHIDSLKYHAHAADIAIVTRPGEVEYLEEHFTLSTVEEFTLSAGCPVLVLPPVKEVPTFGQHILVAWKANREALRAVRGGLSLLRDAEKVTVLTVGPTAEDALSETEFVRYLLRHDISAEAKNIAETDGTGETLLDAASHYSCDMIVMGGYGHSRLREIILGGVTRFMFRNANIPVLMSH